FPLHLPCAPTTRNRSPEPCTPYAPRSAVSDHRNRTQYRAIDSPDQAQAKVLVGPAPPTTASFVAQCLRRMPRLGFRRRAYWQSVRKRNRSGPAVPLSVRRCRLESGMLPWLSLLKARRIGPIALASQS